MHILPTYPFVFYLQIKYGSHLQNQTYNMILKKYALVYYNNI